LNPVRGREQAGLRPVLILSHDLFNKKSETVIAMAISQIRTISVDRLGKKVAVVDTEMLGQLIDGLLELIG
jgi:mRNA interferase MazF